MKLFNVCANKISLSLSSDKIRHLAADLQKAYSSDLEEYFPDEMVRFSSHLNHMDENVSTPEKLLRHIRESDIVDAYPNVKIALRLCLTLPVANTEGNVHFLSLSE